MAWYNFWKTPKTPYQAADPIAPQVVSPWATPVAYMPAAPVVPPITSDVTVARHFYNPVGFQTYASFFAYWDGWITAGHCLTESANMLPDFADGPVHCHPDGLDAATLGCQLPDACPAAPYPGQDVTIIGYPAGSHVAATRHGKVYIARPGVSGSWIAHIITPDEPVVSGMSGGAVIDTASGTPIGIIITRNSPADLNNDRDPDESCDFTALSDVWRAVKGLEKDLELVS